MTTVLTTEEAAARLRLGKGGIRTASAAAGFRPRVTGGKQS